MKTTKTIIFFALGIAFMATPIVLRVHQLEPNWMWLAIATTPIACILLYKAGGLAVLGIAENVDKGTQKAPVAVRTDNGQPDPILTREFLESYVEKQLVGVRKSIYDANQRCHFAWYRTMSNGEKVGWVMYGDPSGGGYVDVEGIFSFVEATNGDIGPHVSAILTPSPEAEAEFKKLNDEADHEYHCSGGGNVWVVPTTKLKIGRADAFRLLANLPKAGSSK